MIDREEQIKNKSKWDNKLEKMKAARALDKPENNMLDSTGRQKTIDDFKGTEAYVRYMALNDGAAKNRKRSKVYGGTKGRFK